MSLTFSTVFVYALYNTMCICGCNHTIRWATSAAAAAARICN